MDAELKARWIEALESGSYKKGWKRLRDDDHFCCLGVLCEITHQTKTSVGYMLKNPTGVESAFESMVPDGFCGLRGSQIGVLMGTNDTTPTFTEVIEYIKEKL